jgi:SPP1 gp7 family putative phage head morphogenesis protein
MAVALAPAALRLVREIRLRRQLGIADTRRAMPRQQPPSAIARDYARELLEYVRLTRRLLEPLFAELPAMLERAAAERTRGDARTDAGEAGKRVREAIDQAQAALAAGMQQPQLEQQAERFANETQTYQRLQFLKQTRAALGIDVTTTDRRLGALVDGFASENVALIKDIPARIMRDVELATTRALANGTLWKDLAEELEGRFGFSEARAKLIARDQIGKLYGQVAAERHREIGVKRFKWRTVHDGRVRDTHAALDGKTFSYDQPPSVGIPGEPVNCRCMADPVLDDILDALDDDEVTESPLPTQPASTLPGYTERVTPVLERRGNKRRGAIPQPPAPAPAPAPPAPAPLPPAPAAKPKKPRKPRAPAAPKPKAPAKLRAPKVPASDKSRDNVTKHVGAHKWTKARAELEREFDAAGMPRTLSALELLEQHRAAQGLPPSNRKLKREVKSVAHKRDALGEFRPFDNRIVLRADVAERAGRFGRAWAADAAQVRARLDRAGHLAATKAAPSRDAEDIEAFRAAYNLQGLHALVHETFHGYGPRDRRSYQYKGPGLLLEEMTTEFAARGWIRSRFAVPAKLLDRGAGAMSVGGYEGWCAQVLDMVQAGSGLSREAAMAVVEQAALAYKRLPLGTVPDGDAALDIWAALLPGDTAAYKAQLKRLSLTEPS